MPMILRRARDARRRHRPRAHRAGARRRRLRRRREATACRSTSRWTTTAASRPTRAALRGPGRARGGEADPRDAGGQRRAAARTSRFRHSYPHCWRHKTPIIFRATTQWFIGMDSQPTGKPAPGARCARSRSTPIANTRFYPGWGRARIDGMIDNRPDWSLSRQRNWGVPMPFFLHRETERAASATPRRCSRRWPQRVEQGGIEAWFAATCEDFGVDAGEVPQDHRHARRLVRLRHDALHGAARPRTGTKWPADLYLEGSDQHRGWFQSCLLTGCAMDGRAPYDALLTHGFVVDGAGPQDVASRSATSIAPQKVSDTLGAEILRLWVASTDYSGELYDLRRDPEARGRELPAHPQHAALPARQHRRLRSGEGPAAAGAMARDRPLRARDDARDGRGGDGRLRALRVPPRGAELQTFCSEDLGGFYLDILKDRLYTAGARLRARGARRRARCTTSRRACCA